MERKRRRRQRRAQDQPPQPLQDRLQAGALEKLLGCGIRRTQALDQAMHHRAEELGLVAEAAVDGALGHARLLRHLLDAGGAIAVAQKERRGDVQDLLADLLRLQSRRPSAVASGTRPKRARAALRSSWRESVGAASVPTIRCVARWRRVVGLRGV